MKGKTRYYCQECGHESLKWLGKCPSCNSWNTMVEEVVQEKKKNSLISNTKVKSLKLNEISCTEKQRIDTGIKEVNRVLGGGLVNGELILLSGDPGIGKSTLTLQICDLIKTDQTVLYVTGEESGEQVKMRAERLKVTNKNLYVLAETDLDLIETQIEKIKPGFLIIDSIQTVYLPEITSAPGSVSQLRASTNKVLKWAKGLSIPTFLVGHVTKEGSIAGPRVLEHMVDCVLYFEGERHYQYRILRGLKNRFGSTNEIGIFEMNSEGLEEVINPSKSFLAERPENGSGSAVVASMEGSRPLLVEIQALVTATVFGQPRRMTTGTDFNRVNMIMAVLDKRIGMHLSSYDAYINVVGGLKVYEPATDLAIAVAIASSFKNVSIKNNTAVVGEIGLTGELRSVSHLVRRLEEASKLGFDRVIIPYGNYKEDMVYPLEVLPVKTLREALDLVLEG